MVVPVIGAGTYDDPKRPALIPPSADFAKLGIASYRSEISPTGDIAIVEIVARTRTGITAILQEAKRRPGVYVFERGNSEKKTKLERDAEKAEVEGEFKKRKADFDLEQFLQGAPNVGRAANPAGVR